MEKPFFRIIQSPEKIYPDLWTVNDFYEVYSDKPKSERKIGSALAYMSDNPNEVNPDKLSLITLRCFIENSTRLNAEQKYIIAVRFYSLGDMATIDLISLDKDYHKEIASEHLKRLGWSPNSVDGISFDEITETFNSPYLFVGGYVANDYDMKLNFRGSSSNYGSDVFSCNSNDLGAAISTVCGISTASDYKKGKAFIEYLLTFMKNHKGDEHFYERFFEDIRKRLSKKGKSLIGNHLSSLMFMKSADRAVTEDKDYLQMSVEEMSTGFGRFVLVSNVAHAMEKKLEK